MSSGRPTKTNRRDFLSGRSALEAAADVLAGSPELPTPSSARSQAPQHLLQVSREAMACLWEVILPASEHARGAEAAIEALDLVDQLESQLTVYRDSSEVSLLNSAAASDPVVVEQRLFELFAHAKKLHALTGGAFDITAGPLTKTWGFYRRQGRMPSGDEIATTLALVGSHQLELDELATSVRFAQPGMEINLGAIGKGYTLDRCGQLLREQGVRHALVHGGNSSILAIGDRYPAVISPEKIGENTEKNAAKNDEAESTKPATPGWSVALRHPLKPQIRLAEFRLVNEALGTSGSGTQFFHHEGKRYGHIIDPRTGMPAAGVLSATVIAPSAADADALSTACYVLGLEAATKLITSLGLSALLVTQARGTEIELCPINLADDRWHAVEE